MSKILIARCLEFCCECNIKVQTSKTLVLFVSSTENRELLRSTEIERLREEIAYLNKILAQKPQPAEMSNHDDRASSVNEDEQSTKESHKEELKVI